MYKFSTHESPKSVWKSRLWRAFSTNGNSAIPYPDFPQSPHPSKSENPQLQPTQKGLGSRDFPQKSLGRRRHVFPDGQSSFPQPSSCPSGTRPESAANAVEQLCTFSVYDLSRQWLSFTTNLFLQKHKKKQKSPRYHLIGNLGLLPLNVRNLRYCWAMLSPRFAHLLSTRMGPLRGEGRTTGPIRGTLPPAA